MRARPPDPAGPRRILVVNAGSSSLKLRVVGPSDELVATADPDLDEVAAAVRELGPVDAVGHRIVHGGTDFTGPVRVSHTVERRLDELTALAPLHQPVSLRALRAVSSALPSAPAVACFDTAFHAGLPAAAQTYALPQPWRIRWGLRRFGFHGLSHAYAARRVAELLDRPRVRAVICHLGSGASLCAVRDGRSVDTTMGFTPLEGLVMATRSGSVDPGLVLWLAQAQHVDPGELTAALEHDSGLLGLAGTSDMREVVARAAGGDAMAGLAFDVYVHRLRAGIAAMTAALGDLDALVFTGGVGENAPAVRAAAAEGLGFLGVRIDPARNAAADGDTDITLAGGGTADTVVRTLVIAAREDLQIAAEARQVLRGSTAPSAPAAQ